MNSAERRAGYLSGDREDGNDDEKRAHESGSFLEEDRLVPGAVQLLNQSSPRFPTL